MKMIRGESPYARYPYDGGYWHPGKGWVWISVSTTIRVFDSLARRGLVIKVSRNDWDPTAVTYYDPARFDENGRRLGH